MSGADADRGQARYTSRRGARSYWVHCQPGVDPDPKLYTLWQPATAVHQWRWTHCAGCGWPLTTPEPSLPT